MKVRELIVLGKKELDKNSIDESLLKSKLILEFVLKKNREYLIANSEEEVDSKLEKKFLSLVNKVKANNPVQYIVEKQSFMGYDFYVNSDVLIPRFDTETLVLEVVKRIERSSEKEKKEFSILDIGTGSGAIIISVAKLCEKIKTIKYTGTDISKKALGVAKINAKNNYVNVEFIESNLFENINEDYNIIISNPPYIRRKVIDELDEEVKKEPILALDGGEDGLDFYRRIAKDAKDHLKKNGFLCFEIGYDQKNDVVNILRNEKYQDIYCMKDMSLNDRVIVGRKG